MGLPIYYPSFYETKFRIGTTEIDFYFLMVLDLSLIKNVTSVVYAIIMPNISKRSKTPDTTIL